MPGAPHTGVLAAEHIAVTVLYMVVAARAGVEYARARAQGYRSNAGRFAVAMTAVFALCGISGYALAVLASEWAPALAVRIGTEAFLILSTLGLIWAEFRYRIFWGICTADGEREAAQAETEDLYELLAEREPVLRVEDLESGLVTHASPALLEMTGVKDPTGHAFLESVHPEDRDKTVAVVAESVVSGEPIRGFRNRWGTPAAPGPLMEWTQIGNGRIWLARDVSEVEALRAEAATQRDRAEAAIGIATASARTQAALSRLPDDPRSPEAPRSPAVHPPEAP